MEQSEKWLAGHRLLDMEVREENQPEPIVITNQNAVIAYLVPMEVFKST